MYEAILIGLMSGTITFLALLVLDKVKKIDDPCGSFAVHGLNGAWGLIAVGIFSKDGGILYNGGPYLLGVQILASFVIGIWSLLTTAVLLWCINKIVPIRSSLIQELLGADYIEHNILHGSIGIENAVDILKNYQSDIPTGIDPTGRNLGHNMFLEDNFAEGYENLKATLDMIFDQDFSTSEVETFVKEESGRKRPYSSQGGAFGRK